VNKKIIGFTAVLILASVNVFAQLAEGISFNAWGRGVFLPLIVRSDKINANGDVEEDPLGSTYTAVGKGGGKGFEHELYLRGDLDYVGFQLGLTFDGEAQNNTPPMSWYNDLGAAIWVKPLGNEWLKVTGGTFIDETLRGKIGEVNGGFEEFVLPGARGKDDIFTGFGKYGTHENVNNLGFMLSSVPLEGLFIGVRVNAAALADPPKARASDVYKYLQIGAGYEIAEIGHARLQYFGGYLGKQSYSTLQKYIDDKGIDYTGTGDPFSAQSGLDRRLNPTNWHSPPARIEAAFALTAVEDLLVDVGFKCWIPVTTGGKVYFPTADYDDPYVKSWGGMAISAAAIYTMDDLSVTGRVDSTFGSYKRLSENDKSVYGDTSQNKLTLDVRLVPSYNLGFAKVGLDFGYAILNGNDIDANGDPYDPSKAKSKWGIGGFISKGFSNGYIKGGVTYTHPLIFDNKDQKAHDQENMIQIPIILEYSF
jgi:hypothetical protein